MPQNIDKYWSDIYQTGRDFNLASASLITRFLSFTDPALTTTCLDIGCGTGQLTRELYHKGYACVGIDASASAIEIAQSLTVASDLQYMQFDIEHGDINKLPLQPYSLITCKLVYAFIQDKAEFLNRVKSLLDGGGVFVIITPLLRDVVKEKACIAVDYEQTSFELQNVFSSVHSYSATDSTTFVCRLREM